MQITNARFRNGLVLALYADIFVNKFTALERTDAMRVTTNTATYNYADYKYDESSETVFYFIWQSGGTDILNRIIILVWPTSWTPTLGGLIVRE